MLAVVDTCDGPEAIGFGICRFCGWRGWGTFDIGLVALGDGSYEHDGEPEVACPRCSLHEVDVHLDGSSASA